MGTLQTGWSGAAENIVAAGRLARIKRWAALALAVSFFLPLYSCTGKVTKEPPAVETVARQGSAAQAVAPRHVEFTPVEAYSLMSWQGGLVVIAFAWPLMFQSTAALAQAARRSRMLVRAARRLLTRAAHQRRTLAWTEVLLCVASAAGIGWALWFGAHFPGFAPEIGSVVAVGALAAYLIATVAALRTS